eukprot:3046573-Rhodomonas_salina.1
MSSPCAVAGGWDACVAAYASSVPHIASHHTLSQYPTAHGTIRFDSTAHRTPRAQPDTDTTMRYVSTGHGLAARRQIARTAPCG